MYTKVCEASKHLSNEEKNIKEKEISSKIKRKYNDCMQKGENDAFFFVKKVSSTGSPYSSCFSQANCPSSQAS